MIREFPGRVTTGSAEGLAQGIAARMREARERRAADRGAALLSRRPSSASPSSSGSGQLRDSGVLSADEFAAEKKRILEAP